MFVVSTLFSVGTQIKAGRDAKRAANFQAAQADKDADAEREAAALHADKIRRQAARARGSARADLAASGVAVDSGTALVIDEEIVKTSEEDAMEVMLYGDRRADRFESEATGLRMSGSNAARQGAYGAFGSVLSAGADYYGGGWRRRSGTYDLDV